MTKRNKIRYQAKPKARVAIRLTGTVYLEYEDEEKIDAAQKGDITLFPQCEALHTTHKGEYWTTGFSGYFKANVFDGKQWQPVLTQEIFTGEQHFSKKECPIDTYELCKEAFAALAGRELVRTYREHYQLEELD